MTTQERTDYWTELGEGPSQSEYRSRHVISTDKWYDLELLYTTPEGATVWRWKLIGKGAEGQAAARKWEEDS